MYGRNPDGASDLHAGGAAPVVAGLDPAAAVLLVAETADDVFWTLDPHRDAVLFVSSAYERVWKRSAAALLASADDWRGAIPPEDRAATRPAYDALLRHGTPFEATYRVEDGEGRWRWARERAWAVRDADGRVALVVGIVCDVTRQTLREEHQHLLMREMSHRVKNTLATILSMSNQTAAHAPSLPAYLEAFTARVHAFSGAHDLLMQNAWTSVPLEEVVARTLAPYREDGAERVALAGPTILLPHDPAVALNLVFHELATNAAKYGALSAPTGRVAVTWSIETDGEAGILNLRWEESGGPEVRPQTRRGFGSRLVERTLSALGGQAQVNYAASGLDYWIALPLQGTEWPP